MVPALSLITLEKLELTEGCSLALVLALPSPPGPGTGAESRAAVRAVLRSVLARLTAKPLQSLRIEAGAQGKPYLAGGDRIVFSLSHAKRYSLVALSLGDEIGCDIEDRFAGDDVDQLSPLVLHPQELQDLAGMAKPERTEAFKRYWVRKEAALKAAGTGFLSDPRALWVGRDDGPAPMATERLRLHDCSVATGCLASVASHDPDCHWHEFRP